MKFLQRAVALALLLPLGGCSQPFPDATLVAVPSPNNSILYEQAIDGLSSGLSWGDPSIPIKIQSNVPLTVQRYDWSDVWTEGHPIDTDEGRILVTSSCDTSETTVKPNAQVKREGGEIFVDVTLPVSADDAAQMSFLQSSSFEAVWYEAGCIGITRPPEPTPSPVEAPAAQTACLTEADCKDAAKGFASFRAGDFPTKGCFFKDGAGIAFWGRGGTAEEKSKASLPGVRKRLWCEGPVDVQPPPPKAEGVCTSKEECDQKRTEMGIAGFRAGAFPTKGCFTKGGNAYWGIGGSDEEISKPDLPGQQQRIWCDESANVDQCEIGPMADPGIPCSGGDEFCQLGLGVCNNKSGMHVGTCEEKPEECIEIFQPVCGCDGKTYGNECKAHSQGISVSRPGQCQKVDIPCLTEDECDEQRQRMGVASFYSGEFATTTKGCFLKGEKAFFSEGTTAEMSKSDLPGAQERLWCNGNGASATKSALQQENVAPKLQQESAASGASSSRSLMLGSLLQCIIPAKADLAHSAQSRALDTCTYNVEVLLSGCNELGSPADIEVKAPKARTIASEMEVEREEVAKQLRVDATLSFPDDQAVMIDASVDSYSDVPPFDEDQCLIIVCGRPFSGSMGNNLLASSCVVGEDAGALSWLGNAPAFDYVEEELAPPMSSNSTINSELGQEWTRNALAEHASVASFGAFSIALMTNGAPSDLVEDSLKAALDEVNHAKASFDIASKLVGREVGPGPLPPSSHHFNQNLTALALSVAKEGCVDETMSALVSAAEVELIEELLTTGEAAGSKYAGVSKDVLLWIRAELHTISIDESRHSALAWRTLRWVCTVDVDACDAAKRNVLEEKKLSAAFNRFGKKFEGHPQLLHRITNAWTDIFTSWKSHINADRNASEAPTCSEGAVGEVRSDAPLLALVAEQISRGLSQCRL